MRVMVVMVAVVLSACAAPAPEEPAAFDSLQATEETGILRGLVVDDTIVPVAGAHVAVQGGPNGTTDTGGLFGFDGLEPGFYAVEVDAYGFTPVTLQAQVIAGDPEPPLLRVRMERIFVPDPFVEAAQYAGHLECSVTVTLDFSACSFPQFIFDLVGIDPLDDRQVFIFEVGSEAHWVQLEMIWESTQPLGSHMALNLDATQKDDSGWYGVSGTRGPSPLATWANATRSVEVGYGNTTDVMMRIFSSDIPETRLPDPCIPQPVLGYCFLGIGATIDQSVDLYLHVFHHAQPEPGWTFAADGSPTV